MKTWRKVGGKQGALGRSVPSRKNSSADALKCGRSGTRSGEEAPCVAGAEWAGGDQTHWSLQPFFTALVPLRGKWWWWGGGGFIHLFIWHFLQQFFWKDSVSLLGFPDGPEGKASAHIAGDPGSVPGLGRSLRGGNGNPPTPVFLSGECHGQRSLVHYGPRGHKELDTTERLHFSLCLLLLLAALALLCFCLVFL